MRKCSCSFTKIAPWINEIVNIRHPKSKQCLFRTVNKQVNLIYPHNMLHFSGSNRKSGEQKSSRQASDQICKFFGRVYDSYRTFVLHCLHLSFIQAWQPCGNQNYWPQSSTGKKQDQHNYNVWTNCNLDCQNLVNFEHTVLRILVSWTLIRTNLN